MSVVNISLVGTSPLVMHSNRCVNPLDPLTKQKKAVTDKKKKTDADYAEIARLDFIAGIYADDTGPYIPMANIRKNLIEGARRDKNGKQFEQGLFVDGKAYLEYEGPRDVKALYEDGSFTFTTVVGNQRNSVMRTRPRFNEWKCDVVLIVDDLLITVDMLENALRHAEKIGLCDARNLGYGRFSARIVSVVDELLQEMQEA